MSVLIATYNVLAPSYVQPDRYPHTPPELLDSGRRIPALADHLASLGCDLFCLQEVEREVFSILEAGLSPLGYAGDLCLKGQGKPDGCAAFYRLDRLALVRRGRLEHQDELGRRARSGHVAQLLVFEFEDLLLGVANTHLKWDPSGTPRSEQYGYRQVIQLLEARTEYGAGCSGWIVCGDLNVTADSDVVRALRDAGFASTHSGSGAATCNSNRRAKQVDFIFHDAALAVEPLPLSRVEDHTPLPGPEQPSDHVAVLAQCTWRTGRTGPHPEAARRPRMEDRV